ncbi:MAG: hypothetical protein SGPRY_008188 [Prymnesium sp.]
MVGAASGLASEGARSVLRGLRFALSAGGFHLSQKQLKHLISTHGGQVDNTVHQKVSFVLASEQAIRRNTQAVRKARKRCIPLLHPDFITASVRSGTLANAEDFSAHARTTKIQMRSSSPPSPFESPDAPPCQETEDDNSGQLQPSSRPSDRQEVEVFGIRGVFQDKLGTCHLLARSQAG